jgi:hypothetical protein
LQKVVHPPANRRRAKRKDQGDGVAHGGWRMAAVVRTKIRRIAGFLRGGLCDYEYYYFF